jgi:predicted transcriptional regulator
MKTKVESLLLLDVPRTVANVIAVLSDGKEHSLRDIERKADLRQPEVSIAIGLLSSYVTVEEKRGDGGRGRPQKFITMRRGKYVEYIDECVACYEVACNAAKGARKELLKE